MANKIFLNKNGTIEQIYEGKQTFKSVVEEGIKVMTLSDGLRTKNKNVRILVNIGKITNVSAGALLAASDVLNSNPDSKIAVFGGKAYLNRLASLVILATGRKESVKVFKTRTQAERWLKR